MPSAATPSRFPLIAWLVLGVIAAWAGGSTVGRAVRITRVTGLPEWSVDAPAPDQTSPTGYEHGWRRLILPEHNYASYQWITQAQGLLDTGRWRTRRVDYENAPLGRPSCESSPYAWWLAGLAWLEHGLTGWPAGLCVEHAALYADPMLLAVLLAVAFVVAGRMLDGTAALIVGVGGLSWFPFSANFVPGAPDLTGLWLGLNLLAGLLVASALDGGAGPTGTDRRHARWRFAAAGALHGCALWLDAVPQSILIAGFWCGGVVLELTARRRRSEAASRVMEPGPWRAWAASGSAVALAGYLVEFAPRDFDLWQLSAVHPLYALAWLGLVEILVAGFGLVGVKPDRSWRRVAGLFAGTALVAGLPVLMWRSPDPLPWRLDPNATRLSVVHAVSAENLFAWLRRDGLGLPIIATLLPIVPALIGLRRRRPAGGGSWIVLAGPCLLTGAMASGQLAWWSAFQACLLAVVVAARPRGPGLRWRWIGGVACAGLPGLVLLTPLHWAGTALTLHESELAGIVERDLAHRLGQRGAEGVVLAPPDTTAALHFYAGLDGLGTLVAENRAGLTAAARIASASSPDEAAALMQDRNVTHVVMPGWDDFLDEYAGLGRAAKTGAPAAANSFVAALHRWQPPPWLRLRDYRVPAISGREPPEVVVFETTDPQDAPTTVSRMAEYFVESGREELAARSLLSLASFPANLGALAAKAKVEAARGDGAAFAGTMGRLLSLVEAGADRNLAWDRRVTLAIVLYSAKRPELARAQAERCLREGTPARLRALSTQSILQLLLLARRLDVPVLNPELGRLAVSLLPPESRARLR